jgi:GNAT superfamily N-acetyltransferase
VAVATIDAVRATVADRERVVDTVVSAFRNDPAFRYFFPDEAAYRDQAGVFAGHLFDRRVVRGTVWVVEGGAAVTMWDAPGEDPADPVSTLDLPPDARARLEHFDAVVGAALPADPFWYLGVVATHPDHAGRRWGRALMAAGLDRAATAGLPAYLETANPRNVDLYRNVGWEVVAHVTAGGAGQDGTAGGAGQDGTAGLPVWVMRWPAAGDEMTPPSPR